MISIYFTIGHIIFVFTTYILHMLLSISRYCKAFYDTIFNLITYFAPNHFKIMASLIYQKGTSNISVFCFYLAKMLFKMHHQASLFNSLPSFCRRVHFYIASLHFKYSPNHYTHFIFICYGVVFDTCF